MNPSNYIGIYFRKNYGGIICFYDPEISPRFLYFKPTDSIEKLSGNIELCIDRFRNVVVHINRCDITSRKLSDLRHEIIGFLYGAYGNPKIIIKTTDIYKIKNRIMSLLDIHRKRDFIPKLISKGMHENKYGIVHEMTGLMSRQRINDHMHAYMLAYYGYLKQKIKQYNIKENIHGEEENRL